MSVPSPRSFAPPAALTVPDERGAPSAPSELDVATQVYGPGLPRSPHERGAHWAEHVAWVRARAVYLAALDAAARERVAELDC